MNNSTLNIRAQLSMSVHFHSLGCAWEWNCWLTRCLCVSLSEDQGNRALHVPTGAAWSCGVSTLLSACLIWPSLVGVSWHPVVVFLTSLRSSDARPLPMCPLTVCASSVGDQGHPEMAASAPLTRSPCSICLLAKVPGVSLLAS